MSNYLEQHRKPSHFVRNTLLGIAAVAVAVVVVGAVVSGDGQPQKEPMSASPSATPSSTPPIEEPTPTPTDSGIATLGQWFTYPDGIKVQVARMQRFRLSSTAAGGKPGDVGVLLTVTIRNGTGKTFDAALASVNLAAGPNGAEAERVVDFGSDVGTGFTGSIPAGRSRTARYGFAVTKPNLSKLVAEVSPDWDHNGVFFEGAVQ